MAVGFCLLLIAKAHATSCRVQCPGGGESEQFDCDDPNYVPACPGGNAAPAGGSGAAANNAFMADQQRQAAAAAAAKQLGDERRAKEEQDQQTRDEQFIQDRDAGTVKLRGIGTLATGNTEGSTLHGGLLVDPGLREADGGKSKSGDKLNDLTGKNAAWKQLNCAAGISDYAFAALRLGESDPRGGRDFDEYAYLSGEAISALSGGAVDVECPRAAPLPRAYGKESADRYKKEYLSLLKRDREIAELLKTIELDRFAAQKRVMEARKAHSSPPADAAAPRTSTSVAEGAPETGSKPAAMKAGLADEAAAAAMLEAERQFRQFTIQEAETRKKLGVDQNLAKQVEAGDADALSLLDQESGKQ